MAKGFVDIIPEAIDQPAINVLLPRGVTVVSSETYGSAVRVTIEGDGIEDGSGYQLVATDSPMERTIKLVKNPLG